MAQGGRTTGLAGQEGAATRGAKQTRSHSLGWTGLTVSCRRMGQMASGCPARARAKPNADLMPTCPSPCRQEAQIIGW